MLCIRLLFDHRCSFGSCGGLRRHFLSLLTNESCCHSEGGIVSHLHIFFGRPSAHSFRLVADLVSFSRYCHRLLESRIVGGFGLGIVLAWGYRCLGTSLQYCHYLIMNDSGSLVCFLTGSGASSVRSKYKLESFRHSLIAPQSDSAGMYICTFIY